MRVQTIEEAIAVHAEVVARCGCTYHAMERRALAAEAIVKDLAVAEVVEDFDEGQRCGVCGHGAYGSVNHDPACPWLHAKALAATLSA